MKNIPRKEGLKRIIRVVTRRQSPLEELFREIGERLMEEVAILACRMQELTLQEFIDKCKKADQEHFSDPEKRAMLLAAEEIDPKFVFMLGKDYICQPAEVLKKSFSFSSRDYFYCSPELDGYNTSFLITVYPEQTVRTREKEDIIDRYAWRKEAKPERIILKSVLFEQGGKYFIAAVPSDKKVDFKAVGRELGISSNEAKRILPYQGNPAEIVGREAGAIGPIIHNDFIKNISSVFVDESVKIPYCSPIYDVPMDRRSSLVLSDIADLFDVLHENKQYPQMKFFENR